MSFYLFHRKPETVYFSPTCGAMYPEEPKTDSLFAQILTRLHILAPLPPPDNSINWYQEELPLSKLHGAAPHLGLDPKSPKPDELARVHQLRAELWSVCPDPWAGRWTFLNPGLSRLPWYDSIVSQVASGATVVDLGCGVGLDLRQLADDANATRLYAVDSRPAIWAIGEKLFGADERLEFLEADLIDQLYETNLGSLKGKVDIVVACHLFDQHQYTGHLDVVHRVMELCRVGTRVVGYTLGATGQDATVRSIFQGDYGYRYVHDPKSFRTVWNTIADRTESKWEYEALETIELEEVGWDAEDAKYAKGFDLKALHFIVKRIE